MRLFNNKDLKIILVFSTLLSVLLIAVYGVINYYDSTSYIDAWNSLKEGRLDSLRTPVYPVFLHVMSVIFGQRFFLFGAICVQHLVFIVSLYYFYKLLAFFFDSKKTMFWLTLIYGCLPTISSWNNCILTESLAISGTVFLLFSAFKTYENPSLFNGVLLTVILLFLLFLRPIFIYIIPVFIVIFLILLLSRDRENKKGALTIGASVLITAIACIFYMREFKKEYGIFATSSVSVVNQYCLSRKYGLIDPKLIKDESIRSDIEAFILANGEEDVDLPIIWDESLELFQNYKLDVLQKNIRESSGHDLIAIARSIKSRLMSSGEKPLFFTPMWISIISILCTAFGIYLSTLYLFLLLFTFFLVIWIIKQRTIPRRTLLLYMLGVSNIVVAIVGAQDEWGRLILPSMPIWFILFAEFIQTISIKSISSVSLR